MLHRGKSLVFAGLLASFAIAPTIHAETIAVSQYGRIVATLPWAVALHKGYFKENGVAVTDIIAGAGGGTSLRNLMASDLPFGEVSTTAIVHGQRSGLDLVAVMATSNHIGELSWVTTPESGINSIKDLVGKRVAFTGPRSTTEMVIRTALKKEGLTDKVEAISAGGLGPALTALAQNAVGAAPLTDPVLTLQPTKYRLLFEAHTYFPEFTWAMGVTTREYAQKNEGKIKALIGAHTKAVEFMYANKDETAQIYAKVWDLKIEDAKALLPKYYAWNHWSKGDFSKNGLAAVLEGMRTTGELEGGFDWSKLIDQRFLRDDLKRQL